MYPLSTHFRASNNNCAGPSFKSLSRTQSQLGTGGCIRANLNESEPPYLGLSTRQDTRMHNMRYTSY